MKILPRLKSILKPSKKEKEAEINLNNPNTKRMLNKQYTAEELEIKQMLKVIDKKRIDWN